MSEACMSARAHEQGTHERAHMLEHTRIHRRAGMQLLNSLNSHELRLTSCLTVGHHLI